MTLNSLVDCQMIISETVNHILTTTILLIIHVVVGTTDRTYLKMYDLELTLLSQLGCLGPVTTVYMVQIYVPEYLRSRPSEIDENQHFVRSKQHTVSNI